MTQPQTVTPMECFELLKPTLIEMQRLISSAPCNRAGLALMMAAYAFTVAAEEMGKDTYANAREVADIIVETMQAVKP